MALRRFQNQEAAHVSLIGRCRFFDALKDAVAAKTVAVHVEHFEEQT